MNLGEIRARVQMRFRDSGVVVTDDQTDDHIEAAYRAFLRYARWPFLIEQQTFSVAANSRLVDVGKEIIGSLESIYDDTNERLLQFMPPQDKWRFDLFLQQQTGSRGAVFFRVVGSNLFLIPKPNTDCDLMVFYFTEPASMGDNDEPEIPVRYHEALVVGALAKAYRDDENHQAADGAQAEFEAIMQQAMQELIVGEASSIRAQMGAGAGSGGAGSGGAGSAPVVGNTRLTTEG